MITFNRKNTEDLVVNEQNNFQTTPLATQSLLLLLVLVHNWTTQANPYRSSLFSCMNNQGNFQTVVYNRLFSNNFIF